MTCQVHEWKYYTMWSSNRNGCAKGEIATDKFRDCINCAATEKILSSEIVVHESIRVPRPRYQ